MTDRSCAVCVKRHVVAAILPADGMLGVRAPERLECRALPPVQDVALHARFPTVAADHYCHAYFERDAAAPPVRAQTVQSTLPLGDVAAPEADPKRARRARSEPGV